MDSSGNQIRRYVYGSKQHTPDYFIQNSIDYLMVTDHLGSLRAAIKASDGTILKTMEHDEFGRVISDSSPGTVAFGFAGGLYDHDTGLVRFGARDYDPEIGRWTSKDPIRFDGDGPNLYGYVENDPINFLDRTGLGKEPGAGGGGGAVLRTPITSGPGRAPGTGRPNSIYEQTGPRNQLQSRTFYGENGRPFSRQDFSHPHNGRMPHEHTFRYNSNNQPIGKGVNDVPFGYCKPTK